MYTIYSSVLILLVLAGALVLSIEEDVGYLEGLYFAVQTATVRLFVVIMTIVL